MAKATTATMTATIAVSPRNRMPARLMDGVGRAKRHAHHTMAAPLRARHLRKGRSLWTCGHRALAQPPRGNTRLARLFFHIGNFLRGLLDLGVHARELGNGGLPVAYELRALPGVVSGGDIVRERIDSRLERVSKELASPQGLACLRHAVTPVRLPFFV